MEKNVFLHKNFILKIDKEIEDKKIIISISLNNITHIKNLSFEELEKIDRYFFIPFNKNYLLLYKYLIRLLTAGLFDIDINKENNEKLSLNLYCLRKNKLRTIKIDVPRINLIKNETGEDMSKNLKTIIIDSYSESNSPSHKYTKKNKIKYNIELKKFINKYEENKEYKEIEIKIERKTFNINKEEIAIYYDYLDSHDIFGQSIPYYNLFNNSFDDVFDDLNIIFYHKNYRVERGKDFIKLFFKVFNFGDGEPYTEIFIQALNRKRTNNELLMKMERFYEQSNNEKIEKDKNQESISINNEKSNKTKKITKEENFLKSFLKLYERKKEDNSKQKKIKTFRKILNKSKNKNNQHNNNSNCLQNKRNNESDNILDNYFKKVEKNDCQIEKNEKVNNGMELNEISSDKLDKDEKNEHKSHSRKKKKKDKNKKSSDKSENNNLFTLDKNNKYNIDKESVIHNYSNLFYIHPLDKDDEFEIIFNLQKEEFFLCKICKVFYKSREEVRVHQWDDHLKPFDEIIIKRLMDFKKDLNK